MNKFNLRPLADRVIIDPAPAQEKTPSGIIIPDIAKEQPLRGRIVAVGRGKKDEPMTVIVGDHVLYTKHCGTAVNVANKNYLIMREADVIVIL